MDDCIGKEINYKINTLEKAFRIRLGKDVENLIFYYFMKIYFDFRGFIFSPDKFFYKYFHFYKDNISEDDWNYLFTKKENLKSSFILKHHNLYSVKNWFFIFYFQKVNYIYKKNILIPLTENDIEIFIKIFFKVYCPKNNFRIINYNYKTISLFIKKQKIISTLTENKVMEWMIDLENKMNIYNY